MKFLICVVISVFLSQDYGRAGSGCLLSVGRRKSLLFFFVELFAAFEAPLAIISSFLFLFKGAFFCRFELIFGLILFILLDKL